MAHNLIVNYGLYKEMDIFVSVSCLYRLHRVVASFHNHVSVCVATSASRSDRAYAIPQRRLH